MSKTGSFPSRWPAARGPEAEFLAVALGLALGLSGAAHLLDPGPGWRATSVSLLFFAAAMTLAFVGLRESYGHDKLGACNAVTQARAALAALLIVPAFAPGAASLGVFAIAALALTLDGLDGMLARRAGLVSRFGARFDMEVDAALAAVLALVLFQTPSGAGTMALICLPILGFTRYGFVIAARIWPWLEAPLPPSAARKGVCVAQIATLVALLLPGSGAAADVLMPAAALLVAWSFGRDILWLHRRRARTGA